jgi:hypothetical protein
LNLIKAQLVNVKSDLAEAKAFKKASEKELEKLMIELHSSQLQKQKLKSTNSSSSVAEEQAVDLIQQKLSEEMKRRFSTDNQHLNIALMEEKIAELTKENVMLKEQSVNLTSELL